MAAAMSTVSQHEREWECRQHATPQIALTIFLALSGHRRALVVEISARFSQGPYIIETSAEAQNGANIRVRKDHIDNKCRMRLF